MQRGRGDIAIEVKADIDQASFARAKAKAGSLGGKEEVELKADIDMSSFARAKAVTSALNKETSGMGAIFDRSRLSYGQLTTAFALGLPFIVDTAGALGALTASAAAATAGLGALAIGMGGVATVGFGGIAAIAAPAISSLKDLMTAQTAANKAQSTGAAGAAQSQAAAAQQIKTATEGVTTAEGQLKIAQEGETVAQKALTLARQDAVRQLEDMRRAAIEGGTSEKRAQLSIKQAEENLRTVRSASTSTALDIKDAELSVVEARQNAKDVAIQAGRAQTDYNKAQKKGLDQMSGVVSAQQSLDSATRGVSDARTSLAKATQNLAFQQKQANMATAVGGTSMAALALAQKKAGPEAVKFAKSLKELGHRWKELTKEGKTDFFGILNDGLERTSKRLPLFAKSANASMAALRDGVDAFWHKAADGPGFTKFIDVMTRTFKNSMVPLGDAFGNVAKVLERISVAVAPDLVRMFKGFDEMTQGWVDSTRNAGDLRDTIHGLVNQANTWWKLIKAAADLIVAVLVPGMGQGKKAVEGITASLKEWTTWVNAHPREMRDFFKEGLETTKQLFEVLAGFMPMLFQISSALRPIARAFLAFVKGLNSIKVGNVSALTVLLGAMVTAKIGAGIAGLVGTIGTLKAAWVGVRTAAGGAAAAEAAAAGAGGMGLASGVAASGGATAGASWGTRFAGAARGAMLPVFGGLGLAIAGSIAVQPILKKFHEIAVKAADDFPEPFGDIGKKIADIGIPTSILPKIPEHPGGLLGLLGVGGDQVSKLDEIVKHIRQKFGTLADAPVGALDRLRKHLDNLQASGEDTGGAFRHFTRRMREEFGSLVTAGAHMSQKQRDVYKQMAVAARQNGDITAKQFQRIENAMTDSVQKQKKSLRDAARATGVSMSQIRKFVGDMTVTVSKDYDGMVRVTGHGMELLTSNTNEALRALGIKKSIKFTIAHGGHGTSTTSLGAHGHHLQGQQRGGMIGGQGDGDKVHVMAEPGEGFINKKAVKRLGGKAAIDAINEHFPRFRQGGIVDSTGVRHFASGGIVGLGKSLQKQGYEVGEHPAFGGVHPVHVTNSLHYSGRAIDINDDLAPFAFGSGEPGSLDKLYAKLKGTSGIVELLWRVANHFDHIHIGVAPGFKFHGSAGAGGAVKKLERVLLKGPKGALKDMGQGALDKTWKAANALIAKKTPTGGGDLAGISGVATGPIQKMAKEMVTKIWGAGQWPPFVSLEMGEAGWNPKAFNPTSGAAGLAQALPASKYPPGAWPYRGLESAKLQLQWMMGYIKESYGNPANAYSTWLGRSPHWYQQGGLVKVPSFAGGGTVPGPRGKPQLVEAHGGERITPPSREGKRYALTITNWDEGTGYMREIADDSVDGTASLNNQLSRMHR